MNLLLKNDLLNTGIAGLANAGETGTNFRGNIFDELKEVRSKIRSTRDLVMKMKPLNTEIRLKYRTVRLSCSLYINPFSR